MTKYITNSEQDTKALARMLSKKLNKNSVIVLSGELGTGKTRFVQGIASYFNMEADVCSPTFTIVNEYINKNGGTNIYHFDLYRIKDENDFLDSIGNEYFGNGICVLEWGEQIKRILPSNTIYITIKKDISIGENYREIEIIGDENL